MWFLLVCSNMDSHQSVFLCLVGNNLDPYHYQPQETAFAPKCGTLWFVVIWIHTKMWFLFVCSNMDPFYYKPKGGTFTSKCDSHWFVVIWIHTNMWFLLVCSNVDPYTNQKEPHLHQNIVIFGL